MQYLYVSQPAYSAYYLDYDDCGNNLDLNRIGFCNEISFCNDLYYIPTTGYAEIGRAVL